MPKPQTYAVVPLDVPCEEVQDAVDIQDLVKGEVRAAIFESDVLDAEGLVKAVHAIEDPDTGPELCKLAGIELTQDPLAQRLDMLTDLVKGLGEDIATLKGQPQARRGTLVPQRHEGLEKSQPGEPGSDARSALAHEVLGRDGTWEEAMSIMTTEASAVGGPHNLPPPRRELHKRMLNAAYAPGGAATLAPMDLGPPVAAPSPEPAPAT